MMSLAYLPFLCLENSIHLKYTKISKIISNIKIIIPIVIHITFFLVYIVPRRLALQIKYL